MVFIALSVVDIDTAFLRGFATTTLTHTALLAILLSPFVARSFAPNYRKQAEKRAAAAAANALEPINAPADDDKIPLTIGFANLSGGDLAALVSEDAQALSPLFQSSRVVKPHDIPTAELLFVYAHLNPDGTIKGSKSTGVRQIVQLTKASLLVVASPNDQSSITNALALPGPRTASLVFTLDRNGSGFARMFCQLFQDMRHGTPLLSAWVKIMPQHPDAMPDYVPRSVLTAEGGNIAFPVPGTASGSTPAPHRRLSENGDRSEGKAG